MIPFPEQYKHENDWNEEDIESYNYLLKKADSVIVLHDKYKRGCYYSRDRYLVDNSSVCISYQKRKKCGTAYTVDYALKKEIKILNTAEINDL